jgi:hypothetical protein
LIGYFLQHSPGQHFALPWQQSATGDVAVAVPMNAAKVAIKRRYFIRFSLFSFVEELGREFPSRRAGAFRKTRCAAVEPADAECVSLRTRQ